MHQLPDINPSELMQRDVAWLKRRRAQLIKFRGPGEKRERLRAEFEARLERSRQTLAQRDEGAPGVEFNAGLPIDDHAEAIIEAIEHHPVIVIAGETGSGKSTQLPKLCLAAGRGRRGLIGCTQPRRIAARSVARRVAEELNTQLGQSVGFQVRFSDRTSSDSLVKFMTDGILLAEIHHDRYLDTYDTLIIDEAHERSLNIDFLLGYLKRLLDKRPDLKVIITSATIDTEKLSEHFNNAPVIHVEGRGWPVDIQYQPPSEDEPLPAQVRRAVSTVSRIDPRGDILVFLPGEREIFQVSRTLKRTGLTHTEVLPLYARLPTTAQDRIFKPGGERRIVLATNVAETSLTVPGIRFVIDSGLARISRYAAHSRVLRLPIEPVSQASCQQRAGRCGRIGPGTCIRLFEESDFELRPEHTEPEIQRSGLVGVVLEMLALGLGEPEAFPFVDPPPRKLLGEAWQNLVELGAVNDQRRLTRLGRQLARLPVDAGHGRMLIEAAQRGSLAETLVLVAALGCADVRERPLDQQQAADQAHEQFIVPESDFLTLLKLWQWWQKTRKDHSRNQADKRARRQFLSPQRLHEWGQLHGQLQRIARDEGWKTGRIGKADDEAVHRALLAGLLGMVGQHIEDGEYRGVRGHKFRIFPGSALARRRPGWVMAAELVETARTYARTVTAIKPAWLEHQAAHLLRRRVFDPHWDRRSGRVMGYEQISLHGLILVEKRRTHYGPHDPRTARELFIRHALVRGEINLKSSFLKKNRQLRDELAAHEHKRRRRDVLAGERDLEAFFDETLPDEIYTAKAFGRWYGKLSSDQKDRLLYDRATLLREQAPLAGAEAYPEKLRIGNEAFRLVYRFEPGHEEDGVTLHCPLHLLNRLDENRLQWLVPGLREEKVAALIASLPKSKRRLLIPVAEYARAAVEALGPPDGGLLERLAGQLQRMSGADINIEDFKTEKLDPHLNFLIHLHDEKGLLIGKSRDLAELRERFAGRARREFMQRQTERWQQDGLGPAQIPELPESVTTRGGHRAWPALVEQDRQVGVRLFDRKREAIIAHREGIVALLRVMLRDKLKYLARNIELSQAAQLAWTRVEDIVELSEALRELCLREQASGAWQVRDKIALEALSGQARRDLVERYRQLAGILDECLQVWHEIMRQLDSLDQAAPTAVADVRSQIDDLMYAGFLGDIQAERLEHYPRYLKAIKLRLNALELDPLRDSHRLDQIKPWWRHYLEFLESEGWYTPELDRYRWLVEEFRVQTFAQQLGTAEKVSAERLRQAWGAVDRPASQADK